MPLIGLFYWACAWFGIRVIHLEPANVTLLWLPSGVGLIACLHCGKRALLPIFLASFAANWPGMERSTTEMWVLHTAVAAGADTLAPWLGASWMRRKLGMRMQGMADLPRFLLHVVVGPTLLASQLLAFNLWCGGYASGSAAFALFFVFLTAASLGILLVYPVYEACLFKDAASDLRTESARQWTLAWWVMPPLIWVIAIVGMLQIPAIFFITIPLLLLQLFFDSYRRTYFTLLVFVSAVVAASGFNMGPFDLPDQLQGRLSLTIFLFTLTLTMLAVGLLRRKLFQEIKAREAWQHRASHDFLTSCGNRDAFTVRLMEEMARADRTHRPLALALLDIDHFKKINDRYGHQAGDAVLVQFADHLRSMLRNIDFVARIGGEEFAVLFPETGQDKAAAALDRIRAKIENLPVVTDTGEVSYTFTAGVVDYVFGSGDSVDDLVNAADRLMYRGKKTGRNCVVVATA